MRISDWSSDVCSSDLALTLFGAEASRISFRTAGAEGQGPPEVAVARADLLAQGFDEQTAPLVALLESSLRHRQGVVRFDRAGIAEQAATLGLPPPFTGANQGRSEEPTAELQSLIRISYAV